MIELEFYILDSIQKYCTSDVMDKIMVFFTSLGNGGLIWLMFSIVLLVSSKTRKVGVEATVSLLFVFILCDILLKPIVGRVRPFDVIGLAELLIKKPTDFSFPSGHTASAFAIVSVFYLNRMKYRYGVLFLAIIIAFSRLYLYVHFPSDVLFGVLLGISCGYIAKKLVDKEESNFL